MTINLSALQKQRRDTAANWTAEDPTLLAGEIGLESDTGYWKVGDGATAWTSLAYVSGLGAEIPVDRLADGAARQLLQTDAAGTGVEWTDNVDVPGTLDVTGTGTFDGNVTIAGDLTVNGTTTTINTQDLLVEDKNVIIGNVTTPSDVTADGGGITLKGTTDKTINWVDSTDAWTFSEHVNIASGKEYRIDGTKVLDATSLGSGVVSSSLTSVGTIGTGVWQGTAIDAAYLDSTVVTTGDTGTVTSTMIADGTIVDGDVNASAAIAGTKISPDFGSQNVTTTGTVTGASLNPTSSTVPTNGVYLPAANSVAISTNSVGRLFVDSSGRVGMGVSSPAAPLDLSGDLIARNSTIRIKDSGNTSQYLAIYGDATSAHINSGVNNLVFYSAGTERGRFDSSGRLGLGTSSPETLLHVKSASQFDATNASQTAGILVEQNGGTPAQGAYSTAITLCKINSSRPGGAIASVQTSADEDQLGLAFLTHSSASTNSILGEALRIAHDGKVGVGTTALSTYGGKLVVVDGAVGGETTLVIANNSQDQFARLGINNNEAQIAWDNGDALAFGTATTSATAGLTSEFARIDSSGKLLVGTSTSQGSYNLQCYGTGVWGQGAYVNGSDANIKQNIQDLEPALDVIKAMRPVTFQYKPKYSSDQTIQPGFIAQELQAAMAGKAYVDGVVQQGTTHLNVAYSSIIAVLVKAVQELEAKVAALETP